MSNNATNQMAYSYGVTNILPTQSGGSLLGKINKFAKKTGIVSKGLNIAGDLTGIKSLKTASTVAKQVGYGKKKKH
jgi:hypothetical protein